MTLALQGVLLILSQMQLMTGKHIHRFDSNFVVLEQMAPLLAVFDSFAVKRFAQDFGERRHLVGAVVHQLLNDDSTEFNLQQFQASIRSEPFH